MTRSPAYKISLAFVLLFLLAAPPAFAQTPEEKQAAQETYIPEIKLYPGSPALDERGIRLAYVAQGVSPGNGRYYCGGLNEQQIKSAAYITEHVVKRLPVAAWENIDLKYILLCSEAKADGRVIGGIPVPPIRLLMLAAGEAPGAASRFPFTILHELYHMIEMQKNSYSDSAWDQKFGGYSQTYDGEATGTRVGSGGPGFINGYGKSFPHEERAELFAIHILSGPALQNYIRQTNDALLQDKLNTVRSKCPALLGTAC